MLAENNLDKHFEKHESATGLRLVRSPVYQEMMIQVSETLCSSGWCDELPGGNGMDGLFSLSAWEKVWTFRSTFLLGLYNTGRMAFFALLLSMVLGILFGLMATSSKKALKGISRVYVELIQNTPLILQLCFLYYILAFFGKKALE